MESPLSDAPEGAPELPRLHAPLPVLGWTSQSDASVGLVNHFRLMEERLLRELDVLMAPGSEGQARLDQRWMSIARTDIQRGFMAVERAILRPDRVVIIEVTAQREAEGSPPQEKS